MLKLTKKADYGLIALKHLSTQGPNGSSSAKEIAETYHIPLPLLAKVLQKLVKSRKDSLEIFQQQNRPELAKKEEEEIAVIEKFLPKQMSVDEVKAELSKIITEVGASSPADMGKVMGVATKQLAGKADGKTISSLVKELLAR